MVITYHVDYGIIDSSNHEIILAYYGNGVPEERRRLTNNIRSMFNNLSISSGSQRYKPTKISVEGDSKATIVQEIVNDIKCTNANFSSHV